MTGKSRCSTALWIVYLTNSYEVCLQFFSSEIHLKMTLTSEKLKTDFQEVCLQFFTPSARKNRNKITVTLVMLFND